MKWFGESWGAPVNEDTQHVGTPVGEYCAQCGDPIQEKDKGLVMPHVERGQLHANVSVQRPWHLRCFLKNIGVL
jgi:hypothetical protein